MELKRIEGKKPVVQQSMGLGSWRYNNALPSATQKDLLAASAGPLVALWRFDVDSHSAHRISLFEAHEDLVTVLCKTTYTYTREEEEEEEEGGEKQERKGLELNCTVGYGGEISLWSSDWSERLGSTKVRIAKLVHLSFSLDGHMIAATSLYSGGLITVFRIIETKNKKKEKEKSRGDEEGESEGEGDKKKPPRFEFELVKEMAGCYYCAEWNSDGDLFAYKEILDENSAGQQNNNNNNNKPRWKQQQASYDVMVLNALEKNDKKKNRCDSKEKDCNKNNDNDDDVLIQRRMNHRLAEVAIRNEDNNTTTMEYVNLVALSHSRRRVVVLDTRTLETRWEFTAHGSGLMICLSFWREFVLCPSDDGHLVMWQRDVPVREFTIVPSSGPIFYCGWNSAHDTCWLGNVGGIHVYRVSEAHTLAPSSSSSLSLTPPSSSAISSSSSSSSSSAVSSPSSSLSQPSVSTQHHSFHALTCCGIDVHPSGELVVAGDFACNVLMWNVKTGAMVARCLANHPVRSLCWRGSDDCILIGCTDGTVLSWKLSQDRISSFLLSHQSNSSHSINSSSNNNNAVIVVNDKTAPGIDIPQLFVTLEGTITCLRWEHGDDPRRLGIATSKGVLSVLRYQPKDVNNPVFVFSNHAHKPVEGPQDLSFGSLGKFAEIWSLSWSPDNRFIATTSEDQTTCVWDAENGSKLRCLTGHTLAVTSVDWRMTSRGNVLATCADDRTVRLYDGVSLDLITCLETKDIEDWHTITYLSLEDNGEHLICATQNGYVVVWELSSEFNSVDNDDNNKSNNNNGRLTIRRTFKGKMHVGSIEGLVWHAKSKLIASCSSDCSINAYRLS